MSSARSFLLIFGFLLNACVVVPNLGPEPYDAAVKDFELGLTTKQDVVEVLGPPVDSYFDDESEFLYATTDWDFFAVAGSHTGAGAQTFDEDHFLWVRFDSSDILVEFETLDVGSDKPPIELVSPVASALLVDSKNIEFVKPAMFSHKKGCDTGSKQRELSGKDQAIFVYGSDIVAKIRWLPEAKQFSPLWIYRYDQIDKVVVQEKGGLSCIILELVDNEFETFWLWSGLFQDRKLTITVGAELSRKVHERHVEKTQ